MRILRQRLSFLPWLLVCAVVIGTFLPMVLLSQSSRIDGEREPFTVLSLHWEVAFGASSPEKAEWVPFDEAAKAKLDNYEGTVLLQRPLPDLHWNNPYLYFSMMNRFEAFLDGESIYRFNMDDKLRYMSPTRMIHAASIPSDTAGRHLLIRAEWEKAGLLGHDLVMMGELDQILFISIVSELAFIVYSTLGTAAGVTGLVLFLRRRERIYGWFSLFCLASSWGLLLTCRTLQWFIPMSSAYHWGLLLTPFAIWACMGFYANALNAGSFRYVKFAHYAMGFYSAAAILFAAVAPSIFHQWVGMGELFIALVGFSTVTYALARHAYGSRGETTRLEKRWLLRGYWTFTMGSIVSIIAFIFPLPLTRLMMEIPYLYRVVEGMLPNVFFLFLICTVMVIVVRVRQVHLESERNAAELLVKNRELEQFHRNLEKLVDTRTSELERANRTLAVTLREKAETLAEISVLEERNRIAYEMHDVVGHTLTAAIVQLEATRKLTDRQGGVPQEKLDLLDELVRKGLNDIRKTVRLMKSDEEQPLSLEASLRELIQYAEDTMEVKVESDILLPRELSLGTVTEGVLCHALQEGLTNGIRHGRSYRFRFRIACEENELRFSLSNDGEPYEQSAPGFGLSSMMERVELLGGSVSVRASAGADRLPAGCELVITIPLS
ncbi:hypothetical protein B1748_25915 [Paenibacillus sp. MY03]|uniref:sensor histidine kinase n=1 Tax=Paenibacillus sp. MY03 TaxID=302980 RepID=UPI000B3D3494|nr:histidine kinase [Paenibacillus sp. MY03]OUS71945.1 hypothetical protein B1748_25915 [Paenibacillus sp. MY03]